MVEETTGKRQMSYDLGGQWLFTGRRASGKRGDDLCKLTRQMAIANNCRILHCIIIVMSISIRRDNNVKDPKDGLSSGKDHHVLQVIPDSHPATVYRYQGSLP